MNIPDTTKINDQTLVLLELKIQTLKSKLAVLNCLRSYFEGVEERFRIEDKKFIEKGAKYKAIGSSLYTASAFLAVGAIAVIVNKSPDDIVPVPLLAVALGHISLASLLGGFQMRHTGKSLQEGIEINDKDTYPTTHTKIKPK